MTALRPVLEGPLAAMMAMTAAATVVGTALIFREKDNGIQLPLLRVILLLPLCALHSMYATLPR